MNKKLRELFKLPEILKTIDMSNWVKGKKITYQGRVYDLPEYLELQLKLQFHEPDEPLIPLGSRIKNGKLYVDNDWVMQQGRFTLSKAPKFLGKFICAYGQEHDEYLLNIKIKPNSPIIKFLLCRSPRDLEYTEMICYLGKRWSRFDNEHFWLEIKKQLFKVIDEASD